MADETKGIAGRGLGYFNAKGVLKTKEDLKSENASSKKSTQSSVTVSTTYAEKVSDALGKVESRFIERTNKAIEVIGGAEKDLTKAHDVVTREISTAKELKKAIKDGDSEKATTLRSKLSEIQSERESVAQEIDKNNRDSAGDRQQQLNLGNSTRGKISVKPVSFSARDDVNPSEHQSTQDVEKLIQNLKSDRKDLRSQAQDLQTTKEGVKQAVSDVKAEITAIRKDTIQNIDDAQVVADKVATDIRSGGISLLEQTISKNLSSDTVKNLIEAP